MKIALITGISGQDGAYLTKLLLEKGYEVHGIVRRVALENKTQQLYRLNPFIDRIHLHTASITDSASVFNVIEKVKPHECYHLAAQSFVSHSFEDALTTIDTNINGTLCVLSAIKEKAPHCRFYFAATSEMFGKVHEIPQNEETPFHPRSPYGVSKVAGFDLTRNFRESYGLFACSGILFNHESPVRGQEFVTRKITHTAVKIKLGLENELRLGNLKVKRDWGFAGDFVEAMWLMLQQENPDDYVIATGKTHSVEEFASLAFSHLGLNWEDYVVIDKKFFRPAEVDLVIGDYSKAKRELGWEPRTSFETLVKTMADSDWNYLKNGEDLSC